MKSLPLGKYYPFRLYFLNENKTCIIKIAKEVAKIHAQSNSEAGILCLAHSAFTQVVMLPGQLREESEWVWHRNGQKRSVGVTENGAVG